MITEAVVAYAALPLIRPAALREQHDVGDGLARTTIRGWLQRARSHAETNRQIAVEFLHAADAAALDRLPGLRSPLADLVEVLGRAAAAAVRRLGLVGLGPWQIVAALTRGRLLGAPGS
jgi:hypothetical protein